MDALLSKPQAVQKLRFLTQAWTELELASGSKSSTVAGAAARDPTRCRLIRHWLQGFAVPLPQLLLIRRETCS